MLGLHPLFHPLFSWARSVVYTRQASRCVANVGDEVTSPNRRIGSGMADAVLHDEIAPGVPALPGCARSRRADGAARRGLRAPDALAAALRKRLYCLLSPSDAPDE